MIAEEYEQLAPREVKDQKQVGLHRDLRLRGDLTIRFDPNLLVEARSGREAENGIWAHATDLST